jgi:GT2 family glycosyltransferase
VPTVAADAALAECLGALARQEFRDFEIVIVDNSAGHAVTKLPGVASVTVMESGHNLGYGGAVNFAARGGDSEFVVALNDDAAPEPGWLGSLVSAMDGHPRAGMAASLVKISGTDRIDSAGMLLAADGSSKQRGHGEDAARFSKLEEVLLPSGSAALYRRSMLDEVGWFDERFFLYCEDTDLGLRARWAGWTCVFVADAVVNHRYSHSAGRASPLKAYYVERNRLSVVVKTFPFSMMVAAPFHTVARYFWHLILMFSGEGAAGKFHQQGGSPFVLAWCAIRAHFALLGNLGWLIRARRKIMGGAKIGEGQFRELARRFKISSREVAGQ